MWADQRIRVTGRVSGISYGDIQLFLCDSHSVKHSTVTTLTPEETKKTVVEVLCTASSQWGDDSWGTGVIIDAFHGQVLTAYHVVEDCAAVNVRQLKPDGQVHSTYSATATSCVTADQAILQLSGSLGFQNEIPQIALATAPARKDQAVYFWGLGSGELRYEAGVLTRTSFGTTTDAFAVPGDSGSPVFDEWGRLLGMVTSRYSAGAMRYDAWECKL